MAMTFYTKSACPFSFSLISSMNLFTVIQAHCSHFVMWISESIVCWWLSSYLWHSLFSRFLSLQAFCVLVVTLYNIGHTLQWSALWQWWAYDEEYQMCGFFRSIFSCATTICQWWLSNQLSIYNFLFFPLLFSILFLSTAFCIPFRCNINYRKLAKNCNAIFF